jgi:hypothetical protein
MTIKDLSICFTGSIGQDFIANYHRVRKLYPAAEIILVTFDKIPNEILELNIASYTIPDTGPTYTRQSGRDDNLGRQVSQILKAISEASGKWVLRLRTDMSLVKKIDSSLFDPNLIYIPTLFSRNPAIFPLLFHPSDLSYYGLKNKVYEYIQASASEIGFRSPSNLTNKRFINLGSHALIPFPEQRLFLNYLNKKNPDWNLSLPYATYFDIPLLKLAEKSLADTFALIPEGIFIYPNRFRRVYPGLSTIFSLKTWPNSHSAGNKPMGILFLIKANFHARLLSNFRILNLRSKLRYLIFSNQRIFKND